MSDMEYRNFRVYDKTLRSLQTLYGLTGIKMIILVNDLVEEELKKVLADKGYVKTKPDENPEPNPKHETVTSEYSR